MKKHARPILRACRRNFRRIPARALPTITDGVGLAARGGRELQKCAANPRANRSFGASRARVRARAACALGFIGLKCNKTQLQLHQSQINGSHLAGIIIYLRGVSREPRMKSRPRDERRVESRARAPAGLSGRYVKIILEREDRLRTQGIILLRARFTPLPPGPPLSHSHSPPPARFSVFLFFVLHLFLVRVATYRSLSGWREIFRCEFMNDLW